MVAKWDDEPNKSYPFPHPRIRYFALEIVQVDSCMPDGTEDGSLAAQQAEMDLRAVVPDDPKNFSPYDPTTWGPWLNAGDEFKARDLIRELRDAPQLGVRFNPPPQRERLFKLLIE